MKVDSNLTKNTFTKSWRLRRIAFQSSHGNILRDVQFTKIKDHKMFEPSSTCLMLRNALLPHFIIITR